jgi:hypothetical protein
LGSGEAEPENPAGQLQGDLMAQTLAVVGEIGHNGAPDLEGLFPQMQVKAGKQLQAAGGLGIGGQTAFSLPDHGAGGDILDEAHDLGGIHQGTEAFAQVRDGDRCRFFHGRIQSWFPSSAWEREKN